MNASTNVGRGRRRARLALALATSTALGATLAAPARAQTSAYRQLDANGVDLVRGGLKIAFEEGSIGSGAGRLAIIRSSGGDRSATNWDELQLQRIQVMTMAGAKETVQISRDGFVSWESFSRVGNYGAFTSDDHNGSSLSGGGSAYSYATRDGGSVLFADPTDDSTSNPGTLCASDASQYFCSLPPVSMSTPAGVTIALEYDLKFFADDPSDFFSPKNYSWRLARAINSAGYMIEFSYLDDNTTYYRNFPPATWWRRSGAAFSNTRVNDGAVVASVSYGYSGPSGYIDVTDTAGQTWRVSSGSIQRPGESTPGFRVTGAYPNALTVHRDGVSTSYSRNVSGTITTMAVTDGMSRQTIVEGDLTIDQPTKVTDHLGHVTRYDHDSYGRLTRVTQPEGGYFLYTLDGRGNATETRQVAKPGSGLPDLVSTAVYDATCANAATCNQPTAVTDAGGHTTDFTYTADGHVATVTAPAPDPSVSTLRPQTRYTYYATNAGTQLFDTSQCRTGSAPACLGTPDETRVSNGYDANGNLVGVTVLAGDASLVAATTATVSPRGDVTSIDGPLDGPDDTVHYRYDGARRLVGAVSPDPDGAGARPRRASRTTYNAAGRAVLTEAGTVADASDAGWAGFAAAEGVATNWAGGRRTVHTLVSGGTAYAKTQYGYDAAGRLECTAVRMNPGAWGTLPGACTLQAAAAAGPDRIVRTGYDAAGTLTVSSAYGTAAQSDEVTRYTGDGEVASVSDGEGNRTSYAYDGFDRLARTYYPVTAKGADASSTTDYEELGYDAGGELTSRRLRDGGMVGYSHDALHRLTLWTPPANPNPDDTPVRYSYDNVGQLVLAAKNVANQTHLSWDALGRKVVESNYYYSLSSNYDLAGRRTRLTWHDGFYVTYDHDATGAVTAVRENGGAALATFGYDDLGRRTGIVRGNGTSTSYGYDAVSRLASFGHDLAGAAADLSVTLGYNPAGQIGTRTASNDAYGWAGLANATTGYAADGLNRYIAAGGVTPTYDARGNLTSAGPRTYEYSGGNRLRHSPGVGVLYQDSLERLDYIGPEGLIVGNDGGDAVAEMALVACCSTLLPVTRRYVYAPGENTPLVWYEGAGTADRRWLHTDERGSVIAVTDAGGAALAVNTYDEYGQPGAGNLGRFGYTGQMWLPSLGLNYHRARMYSPALGRFVQPDPIGYGDGLNWYDYVGGDPVNRTDPSGLNTVCYNKDASHYTFEDNEREPTWVVAATKICQSYDNDPDLSGGSDLGVGGAGSGVLSSIDRLNFPLSNPPQSEKLPKSKVNARTCVAKVALGGLAGVLNPVSLLLDVGGTVNEAKTLTGRDDGPYKPNEPRLPRSWSSAIRIGLSRVTQSSPQIRVAGAFMGAGAALMSEPSCGIEAIPTASDLLPTGF